MITQVFPDEFHLHTLDQFLSATARLNPHVNVKGIVIGLMDRLSAYAARESESESPEDRQKSEEEATAKLLEKIKISDDSKPPAMKKEEPKDERTDGAQTNGTSTGESSTVASESPSGTNEATPPASNEDEVEKPPSKRNKGIPDDVKLYEIFYEQVVNLVNAQHLPIQATTALLVSLANLAL